MSQGDNPKFQSAHLNFVAWLLVSIQAALLIAVVMLPGPNSPVSSTWRTLGLVLEAGGLLIVVIGAAQLGASLNFLPTPNQHGQLCTTGLYRFVRHPIYFGVLVFALGTAFRAPTVARVSALIGLDLLLQFKAAWEEQRLLVKYPDYAEYAARTSAILPLKFSRRSGR